MLFNKNKPVIRERKNHCISRSNIDPDAIKVLYRLSNSNFIAYLVGGSVRDLLLERVPKDFDVTTDAQPNQIRKLFRNCFLIGRRFRLAHIVFGRKVIETSTFRATPKKKKSKGLYQREDNTFGTPAEDARRRDFTVNGLFYDIKTFSVIDYVGGLADLERKVIRSIGNPNVRFREDPVRMMRAIRFAAKLDFNLEKSCCRAIKVHHSDILNASVPRICDEVYKLFTVNAAEEAFKLMWQFKLLDDLLPQVSEFIDRSGKEGAFIWKYLAALDSMPDNEEITNGVRTAILYYPLFLEECEKDQNASPKGKINRMNIARRVLRPLCNRLNIPKAVFYSAVAVMDMERRFDNPPSGTKAERFARNSNFIEAFVFKRIVCKAEGRKMSAYDQWNTMYKDALKHASAKSSDVAESSTRRKRRHKSRPRRRSRKVNT